MELYMKFKHYILTRFNLELYQPNPYKVKEKGEWMNNRIELFKNYLNGLIHQTNKNFTVVFAMDRKTPHHYLSQITFLLDSIDVDYVYSFDKQPNVWIKENKPDTEWLITTRLDNDDELKPNFVETIQNEFREEEELLDVKGIKMFEKKEYPYNRSGVGSPFITLIEPTEKCLTAMHKTHSFMPTLYKSRFVGKELLFIQHIHNYNQSNSLTQG